MVTSYYKQAYRFLKKWGAIGHNRKLNLFGVHPLVMSTSYIILTSLIAIYLRRVVKTWTSDNIVRQMLLEFVATAELCASCFELIIETTVGAIISFTVEYSSLNKVADNYGVSTYAIYLFILTVWWSYRWETATACPYSPLEDVFEGAQNIFYATLLIIAQVLGGVAIFRYIQFLWSLELVETHKGRAYEECVADLQVPMAIGAVIEAVSTCVCRIISKTLAEVDARFGNVIDAFFGTLMVVAAFNFSGGYFNPALATSLKYGCKGNTFTEHMVVYWLGAVIGSVASIFVFRSTPIQKYIQKIKPKQA
ncbi:Aquaporin 12L [Rhyzopertha dominica]|nr:Aquaporin 12L [Rhyzopertha dominica]